MTRLRSSHVGRVSPKVLHYVKENPTKNYRVLSMKLVVIRVRCLFRIHQPFLQTIAVFRNRQFSICLLSAKKNLSFSFLETLFLVVPHKHVDSVFFFQMVYLFLQCSWGKEPLQIYRLKRHFVSDSGQPTSPPDGFRPTFRSRSSSRRFSMLSHVTFTPKSDQLQISSCTRKITSHSMKNLAFRSLPR